VHRTANQIDGENEQNERKRTNDMVMTNLASRSLPPGGYGVRQAIGAELRKFTSIRSTPRTLFS
jgi:hypothetical protein